MRALGLLGSALSGGPPYAAMGTGVPDATKYLRGDGVWAALSLGAFSNKQTFTSSGTFTVPAGVTLLAVYAIGGGGGGGYTSGQSYPAGTGGTTSFGSYITAPGGGGGSSFTGSGPTLTGGGNGTAPAVVAGVDVLSIRTPWAGSSEDCTAITYGAGADYAPWSSAMKGNNGASALALIPVTPGQSITVTVGAGGAGSVAGTAGAVLVRW